MASDRDAAYANLSLTERRWLDRMPSWSNVTGGEIERKFDRLYDALTAIANADTKYPSMPSGFTGEWEVLRDEARAVLTEDEDGVWE